MLGKKTKLLFLNHWAEKIGGAERSLIDILQSASQKFDCYLITSEQGPLTEKVTMFGVKVYVIKASKAIAKLRRDNLLFLNPIPLLEFIKHFYKIRSLVKKINPDIIHANIPKSHITILLLKLLGFKGFGIIHLREIFDKKLPYLIYQTLLSKNLSIISVSNSVENALPIKLKAISSVIYNGINIPETVNKNDNKSSCRLLFLGRIVPWKNIEFLINVLYELNSSTSNVNFTLSIIGDSDYGPKNYRESLSQLIKELNLEDKCKIFPATDNITEVFESHDIFVNASKNEPFGRVVAEALSFSMPVAAIDSSGVSEILDSSCAIMTNDSIINFSKGITEIANTPKTLLEMGLSGRARAKKYFNKEIQIQKIIEYILKLA